MKVFVVHKTVGGYCREDPENSSVVGVFTDPEKARLCRCASGGSITEIEVDYIPPGYVNFLKETGFLK